MDCRLTCFRSSERYIATNHRLKRRLKVLSSAIELAAREIRVPARPVLGVAPTRGLTFLQLTVRFCVATWRPLRRGVGRRLDRLVVVGTLEQLPSSQLGSRPHVIHNDSHGQFDWSPRMMPARWGRPTRSRTAGRTCRPAAPVLLRSASVTAEEVRDSDVDRFQEFPLGGESAVASYHPKVFWLLLLRLVMV
jgi:hypothetical protein